MTQEQRARIEAVVKQAATGVVYLRDGTAVYASDDLVPAIAAMLTTLDAAEQQLAEVRGALEAAVAGRACPYCGSTEVECDKCCLRWDTALPPQP